MIVNAYSMTAQIDTTNASNSLKNDYTLYIANKNYSSWSLRPWLILRELAIPFEEKTAIFESDSNWDAFIQFSPAGKVPCLHAGHTIVWDSLGITEYLAERHSGVWPTDSDARSWARCAAAEMHSGFTTLRSTCPMHIGFRIQMTTLSAAFQRDIERLQQLWGEGLQRFGGPYLAGEKFTAIDAFLLRLSFASRATILNSIKHLLPILSSCLLILRCKNGKVWRCKKPGVKTLMKRLH